MNRGLIPNGPDSASEAAIAKAQATADNARQMVNNDRPRIKSLEDVAAQFQAAQASAEQAHASLQAQINNITLKPGPAGKSAYDIATELGYTGTKAQWIASLKGEPGQSIKGDPGKDGAPGKDANVDIRYRDGINVPAVSILNLGTATVNVTVTWDTPFPDANYVAIPQLATTNTALIGKVSATVTSKTATGCVVTVSTTAVLSLGTLILSATAIRKTT